MANLSILTSFLQVLKLLFWTFVGIVLWLIPSGLRLRKSVKNEIILVTGAGSGLGRQLALRLAARGARMVLWDIDRKLNEETEQLILRGKGQAKSYVCDVSDRKSVSETATKVKSQIGPVTMLINNAGILIGKRITELREEEIIKTMNVNALAHFWTCKAFLPDMMASNRGHIVTIASIAGIMGAPKLIDYCSSKFAAVGLTEALRVELFLDGHTGIRTTTICPFFFDSGLYQGLQNGLFKEMNTDEVADRAVEAILTETVYAVIPWWFDIVLKLGSVIPQAAEPAAATLLQICDMVRSFRGARSSSLGLKPQKD